MSCKIVLLCVMVGAISACSLDRALVTADQLPDVAVDKTGMSEVIKVVGVPSDLTKDDDGSTNLRYDYLFADLSLMDYLPIVDSFSGAPDIKCHWLDYKIDKNNLVTKYQFFEGEYDRKACRKPARPTRAEGVSFRQ